MFPRPRAITFTYEIALRRAVNGCADERAEGARILEEAHGAAEKGDRARLESL